ncbi:hypothetical protein [Henriciella aquimarina]|uniref:hypothetical protein n=1 Tax=Henriciella aquimarina TaxID=545261 RepID=UPI000A069514|nr:hypothetical protein [Henriciella aquimarina]
MVTREWILQILWELPLYYWPVFFWELVQLGRWWATNPVEPGAMVTFQVTGTGRIVMAGYIPAAPPSEPQWSDHAPRAPWRALDPQVISGRLAALAGVAFLRCTLGAPCGPFTAPSRCTVTAPLRPRALDPP